MLRVPRRAQARSRIAIGFGYGDPPREQFRARDQNEERKLKRPCSISIMAKSFQISWPDGIQGVDTQATVLHNKRLTPWKFG